METFRQTQTMPCISRLFFKAPPLEFCALEFSTPPVRRDLHFLLGSDPDFGYNLACAQRAPHRERSDQLHPEYTRIERIVDGCVHVAGVTFSLMASMALLASASNSPALDVAALTIYSFGLIAMFTFSACYNLSSRPLWKELFRRLDHAAIYVMIAGSYTPFALIKIGGGVGAALLIAVWTVAVGGAAVKFCLPRRLEILSLIFYLVQGWAILFALAPLRSSVSNFVLWLLMAGGIIYTVGLGFHLSKQLPFHNAIWHGFVLLAASCHYAAIYEAAIPFS
jgi:hemolysin III